MSGHARYAGTAEFCALCNNCPLAAQCTSCKSGRSITIGHHEASILPVWHGE